MSGPFLGRHLRSLSRCVVYITAEKISPLLEADNGIFECEDSIVCPARQGLHECEPVAERLGIALDALEIIAQILSLSRNSSGQTGRNRRGHPTELIREK